VLDDWNYQTPVERDGDTDVDLLPVDDACAGDRRVHHRKCLQALRHGFDDERHVTELLAGGCLELGALRRADSGDAREVDLDERSDVGRCVPRRDHVIADQRAHFGHRLDDIAGPRLRKSECVYARRTTGADSGTHWRPRTRFDKAEYVALGHATSDARPVK